MKMKSYKTVEAYIASFEGEQQKRLIALRALLRKTVPKALEEIKYGMPAYRLGKPLVYFAVQKKHIGFYPTPSAIKAFQKELKPYKTSKGAIQFPYDQKLPLMLIKKMVQFRARENTEKINKTK